MKLLLLLSIGLLSACVNPESEYFGRTEPKHGPNEIWINNTSEPQTIDPGKCTDNNGGEFIANMFAGLVQAHPQTLKPEPDVAERWERSSDGLRYTFHLRKTVWSDGTPLTAHDFEWSWMRLLSPSTGSSYSSLLFLLKNGEAFHRKAIVFSSLPAKWSTIELKSILPKDISIERVEKKVGATTGSLFLDSKSADQRDAVIQQLNGQKWSGFPIDVRGGENAKVGVRAVNDTTLEVELEAPVPFFLDIAAYYPLSPIPRHVLEKLSREKKNPDLWTRPEYVVSNGAYVLKEWKFRQYAVFEKNRKYWNASETAVEKVRMLEIESSHTMLNYYRSADIDWTGANGSLPVEFMDSLSKHKDFHRAGYLAVYFYWFNTKSPPLNDVRIRKALSQSIDRDAIVNYVTRARQIPSSDLVPDGLAGYQGLKNPMYQPEEARKNLAEAGYPGGKNFPNITLVYNTLEGNRIIAESIQQMWKKELGVDITLENEEWKVFLGRQKSKNFQMSRGSWIGDYPDPYTFLELLTSQSGNNHSQWSHPKYDELLRAANLAADPQERLALMREAETLMIDARPLMPIYVYTRSFLKKPYLQGFWENYQDRHPWKYFRIDRKMS